MRFLLPVVIAVSVTACAAGDEPAEEQAAAASAGLCGSSATISASATEYFAKPKPPATMERLLARVCAAVERDARERCSASARFCSAQSGTARVVRSGHGPTESESLFGFSCEVEVDCSYSLLP